MDEPLALPMDLDRKCQDLQCTNSQNICIVLIRNKSDMLEGLNDPLIKIVAKIAPRNEIANFQLYNLNLILSAP